MMPPEADPRQSGPCEQVDHLQQLRALLSNLYNSQDLSDLLIVVNGSLSVHCHRLLLAAQSSVFKTMLSSRRWPEAQQQTISLTEEEQCLPYFEDFLRYFYSGALTLSTDNALPVSMLADKYNVVSLKKCCEEFMVKNVATPGKCNRAIQWRQYAKLADLTELKEACDRFIPWNMDTVIRSPVWRSIDSAYLCDLLQRSDLVVESEMTLLKAAVDWLAGRPKETPTVLQHIRFPMIKPNELYHYQAGHKVDTDIYRYIEKEILLTYQANSVDIEILSQNNSVSSATFSPRLYKSTDNGSLLEIRGYSNQAKRAHQIKFRTKVMLADCEWALTFHPKGETITVQESVYNRHTGYKMNERVVEENNRALTWRVQQLNRQQDHHEQSLTVLLQSFHNGSWFITGVRTFDTKPGQLNRERDLIPESEVGQYLSNDSMRLHFIGRTVRKKDKEGK
ncbi:BTB/POZ domain-containing protein 17 [Amia ocellicauda]|uniref:BTB/POZ domain-containing protein 17 n=1 Tax=Amia ocellicauda TaxID=2972642 RepID=UPI0034639C17